MANKTKQVKSNKVLQHCGKCQQHTPVTYKMVKRASMNIIDFQKYFCVLTFEFKLFYCTYPEFQRNSSQLFS